MRPSAYVRGSLVQLRSNLFRTLLTLLGIVFGVASVIAMITIGEGAQAQILENIQAMGATLVHITPTESAASHVAEIVNASQGLGWRDVQALRAAVGPREVAWVSKVSPRVTSWPVQATELAVFAVGPALPRVLELKVLAGRLLNDADEEALAPHALVTETYATRFCGGASSAVGARIRFDSRWFTIVGVVGSERFADAKASVQLPTRIDEFKDAVFLLSRAYRDRLRPAPVYGALDRLVIRCRDLMETRDVKRAAEAVLAATHQGTRDFKIVAPQELMDQQEATQRIFNIVLLSIAAISLLVGGIGIMNIMLANVLERRNEIGVRRALGAKRNQIVLQFLFESTLICFVGGLIGIAGGVGISFAILKFTHIPIAFSLTPIVLSSAISVGVGLIFGIMPARAAANTNPVEALHSE